MPQTQSAWRLLLATVLLSLLAATGVFSAPTVARADACFAPAHGTSQHSPGDGSPSAMHRVDGDCEPTELDDMDVAQCAPRAAELLPTPRRLRGVHMQARAPSRLDDNRRDKPPRV
jgi:hypothetical protein